MVPDWGWVHMDDRRARWVQVFARLKPGYTVESAEAPLQGLFTQIRALRDDAAGGEGLVAVLARAVHEGAAARRERGDGLLGPAQRFLDGARSC